ncbi:zinc finger BED domain-containing protein 1-like [Rhizophagus clarus]|uniref:Zinc finger BED domain-containing protein 1-like n=1 Tax=Rhizophagus clarus TaxID=94130 RepID=A0A8H3KYY3_9GLOM|nr:zinc finger BED domain-containing protein 1-like [Rhizophagus clarus]
MTTDNRSNIKKAGQLVEVAIFRLLCTAHTLQLVTIGKGLNLVKTLILRAKRLIDFFNFSPKQRERLQTAQEFLGYTQIKHVIGDVSTRWNSTYYAWERLIELKRAIKFLPGQLKSDLNKDAQKDGEKLEKIMLSDDEWLLIEDLLNLLSVFEDVTKLLSGAKYCTISLMYPAIAALIASIKPGAQPSSSNFELDFRENLADDLPDEEITILDSAEVTISDNKNKVEIEVVDLTAITGRCRKKIDITEPIQTKDIVSNIRKLFYNSMFSYWKDIHKVGMLACLLDPRFKKLRFVKQSVRHEAIGELRDLYEVVQNDYNISDDTNQMIPSAEHINPTEHHSNRVQKSILDMIYASPNPADSSEEIDKYLKINEKCKETNPLEWWKLHEKRFPTLATIARKYLGIRAISVPSERLFSDVGNNITNKRINLDPNLVEQMLFLKRNINVMGSIFSPIYPNTNTNTDNLLPPANIVILEAGGNPNNNDDIAKACDQYFTDLNLNDDEIIFSSYGIYNFAAILGVKFLDKLEQVDLLLQLILLVMNIFMALETFGVKYIKENITGNTYNIENLKRQIKAAQSERERMDLLFEEFIDDIVISKKDQTVNGRYKSFWTLINSLLIAQEVLKIDPINTKGRRAKKVITIKVKDIKNIKCTSKKYPEVCSFTATIIATTSTATATAFITKATASIMATTTKNS